MFSEILKSSKQPALKPAQSKRLLSTKHTIASRWVPCHPMLKRRFQSLCLRRSTKTEDVLKALLQDPGLCIFVLRSLHKSFPNKDTITLRTALAEIEFEQLARMVAASENDISETKYSKATRHQSFELQRSVFTTTAASVFAEHADKDAFDTSWAAFCRELGFLLLSWSYPHLYSRAMSRQKSNRTSLSDELEKLLGVTPDEIGRAMLSDWRLVHGADIEELNEPGDDSLSALDIVKLAEMWGQSQDSLYYPTAASDWKETAPRIENALGQGVLEKIKQESNDAFIVHKTNLPLLAESLPAAETVVGQGQDNRKIDLSRKNLTVKSVDKLSSPVQLVFTEVLDALESSMQAQDALRKTVSQIVPLMGFTRGCMFALSKDGSTLAPVLRFGDLPLHKYDEFIFDRYQGMKSIIFQSVPFKRDGVGFAGENVTYICGGLDSSTYQGVLYLEMPLGLEEDQESNPIVNFRCLRDLLTQTFDILLSSQ